MSLRKIFFILFYGMAFLTQSSFADCPQMSGKFLCPFEESIGASVVEISYKLEDDGNSNVYEIDDNLISSIPFNSKVDLIDSNKTRKLSLTNTPWGGSYCTQRNTLITSDPEFKDRMLEYYLMKDKSLGVLHYKSIGNRKSQLEEWMILSSRKCKEVELPPLFSNLDGFSPLSPEDLISGFFASEGHETFVEVEEKAPLPLNPNFTLTETQNLPLLPQRTFKCTHKACGKEFLKQFRLNRHLKIHTDKKRFICGEKDCNASFHERSNLRAHLKTHFEHERFICDICQKGYAQIRSLRRHQTKNHE